MSTSKRTYKCPLANGHTNVIYISSANVSLVTYMYMCIHCSSSVQPATSRSRPTQQDLELRVGKVWKAITMCFQSRHTHSYDSALLSILSPLLVATLNSSSQQLSNLSLSFWAVTFDKSHSLEYPARLRDVFTKYLKESKQPSELKLPCLHGNTMTIPNASKDLVSLLHMLLVSEYQMCVRKVFVCT